MFLVLNVVVYRNPRMHQLRNGKLINIVLRIKHYISIYWLNSIIMLMAIGGLLIQCLDIQYSQHTQFPHQETKWHSIPWEILIYRTSSRTWFLHQETMAQYPMRILHILIYITSYHIWFISESIFIQYHDIENRLLYIYVVSHHLILFIIRISTGKLY